MMEKDNKKARDDAKREYNETVRVRLFSLAFDSTLLRALR